MKETRAEYLPIEKLKPFKGHPFKVTDNEEMNQLVWSILTQGLLTPLVVRPSPFINPIDTALETVRGQIAQLQTQQESICEYLEKGIYSVEMFTKRNSALVKEIKQLQSSEEDLLRQQSEGNQKKQAATEIIPTTRHILENYSSLSPIEKNLLWKLVMKKVTVYRSPDDEVTLHIYPNLPK